MNDKAVGAGGEVSREMERILYEVKKVVVGQDHFLERVLVAILAQGHLLVEGVPGSPRHSPSRRWPARFAARFAAFSSRPIWFRRIWSDTRIYNQKTGEFTTSFGPVFTNLLLADEINRAPAKVQSALLEVMQEYQVTIAGETHRVPEPFLVMATQNPIETEGTYPLPEAQVDRFMMKVLVGYPSEEEEFVIVNRVTGAVPRSPRWRRTERAADAAAPVPHRIRRSIAGAVRGAAGDRDAQARALWRAKVAQYITYGASPRATIHLVEGRKGARLPSWT